MTIEDIEHDFIDEIALSLNESVHGANGPITDEEIKQGVIDQIRCHAAEGRVPLEVAADLIINVWRHKERDERELVNWYLQGCPVVEDDTSEMNQLQLRAAIDRIVRYIAVRRLAEGDLPLASPGE
jgi:hypothetical protein